MYDEMITEARRQVEICNACRYCEGYCSVFPEITSSRDFAAGDITHLANLCHNCRGCYYACQYTEPHEFAINLPKALAEVRQESWKEHAWPQGFAKAFDTSGFVIAGLAVLFATGLFWLMTAFNVGQGQDLGFYTYLSHVMMVAIFAPAFVLPLAAMAYSLRSYWRATGGGVITFGDILGAFASASHMKNLRGGHGEGCNFEDEDAFSHRRRIFHQFTMYGFLLCFASTSSGTILHYGFGLEAPYGPLSVPKLLGVPGGILLSLGTVGLGYLKTKADPNLGAPLAWGGEMAFLVLLFGVSTSGLGLYWLGSTAFLSGLLALHLALVLVLFVVLPYSKMAHGFYRMAALIQDEVRRRHKQL